MPTDEAAGGDLLEATVRFPDHVIFRSFARETVALNLKTGQFHGLNATAGRMVDLIQRSARPRDAVPTLAAEYGVAEDQLARDLADLLRLLLERELVEIDS
jgi:Coenzyme PQQ synthesis protein D (PqqD)